MIHWSDRITTVHPFSFALKKKNKKSGELPESNMNKNSKHTESYLVQEPA